MLRGRAAVIYLILVDIAVSTLMFAAVGLLRLGAVALFPVLTPRAYQWAMRTFTRAALWAWPANRDAILDHTVACLVEGGADARETLAWRESLRP